MKTGLVMEGGGMRGMFTCGVLDILMEENINFDGAAGISAGAVFGCNFKSRQIGRAIRYNKRYCKDKRYCSLYSLLFTGNLYGENFCYHDLLDVLDPFDRQTFKSNPIEFYVGATDVRTANVIYHKCIDGGRKDIKWMQASASLPFVSKIVKVDGYELLDGGIADPVPLQFMFEHGFNKNIIILTQPKGYRKKKSNFLPLLNVFLLKYPNIISAIAQRYLLYNKQMEQIDEYEAENRVLVIRPPKSLAIRRTENDPNKLECAYQIGRNQARKCLADIKKFLGYDKTNI